MVVLIVKILLLLIGFLISLCCIISKRTEWSFSKLTNHSLSWKFAPSVCCNSFVLGSIFSSKGWQLLLVILFSWDRKTIIICIEFQSLLRESLLTTRSNCRSSCCWSCIQEIEWRTGIINILRSIAAESSESRGAHCLNSFVFIWRNTAPFRVLCVRLKTTVCLKPIFRSWLLLRLNELFLVYLLFQFDVKLLIWLLLQLILPLLSKSLIVWVNVLLRNQEWLVRIIRVHLIFLVVQFLNLSNSARMNALRDAKQFHEKCWTRILQSIVQLLKEIV